MAPPLTPRRYPNSNKHAGGLAKCSMVRGYTVGLVSTYRVGPVVPSDQSRYIGSGEAASYRRLPPPEPQKALSRHVPLPVLRGPLGTASFGGRFLFCRQLAVGNYARFDRLG